MKPDDKLTEQESRDVLIYLASKSMFDIEEYMQTKPNAKFIAINIDMMHILIDGYRAAMQVLDSKGLIDVRRAIEIVVAAGTMINKQMEATNEIKH